MDHLAQNCSSLLGTNVTYSCDFPFPNCTIPGGFAFKPLEEVTIAVYTACPSDGRLFQRTTDPSLTYDACRIFAHGNSWKGYFAEETWGRMTSWKFPLLQLAALFQRNPSRLRVEYFSLVHLMGDPITSFHDILLKFETCQKHARMWKEYLARKSDAWNILHAGPRERGLLGFMTFRKSPPYDDRLWMALAAISDAYGEWGPKAVEDAAEILKARL